MIHSRRGGCGCAFIVALVALLFVGYLARATVGDRVATCTVTGKDRGSPRVSHGQSDDSSHYRVYTRQCGTFANEDMWLRGKFRSADIQGELQEGHTYRLHVVGWRFGPFSMLPNILSVQPLEDDK